MSLNETMEHHLMEKQKKEALTKPIVSSALQLLKDIYNNGEADAIIEAFESSGKEDGERLADIYNRIIDGMQVTYTEVLSLAYLVILQYVNYQVNEEEKVDESSDT